MFVILKYQFKQIATGVISSTAQIDEVIGIAYNESDFNKYLDMFYPNLRQRAKRIENLFGPLSLSYEVADQHAFIVLEKIKEVNSF